MPIARLNHAVLFVSDVERAVSFYQDALDMRLVATEGSMAFLRAAGSDNHHDLGLLGLGAGAPRPPRGSTGLYHLAWQVDELHELADMRDRLQRLGAFTGQSDHGATKSLYGADPDGNEFEVMWLLPKEDWGEYADRAVVMPLDLEGEIAKRS